MLSTKQVLGVIAIVSLGLNACTAKKPAGEEGAKTATKAVKETAKPSAESAKKTVARGSVAARPSRRSVRCLA